jgi:hypothetical protein
LSLIAQVGFGTATLEAAATAIGAGVIVVGFLAAAAGKLFGRSHKGMEERARRDVIFGGFVGTLCLSVDMLTKLVHLA